MPYKTTCPSCDHGFDVEGAGDQAKFQERLAAKNAEAKSLAAEIGKMRTAAEEATSLRTERDALRSEIEGIRSSAAIGEAFASAGVADDEAVRASFRVIYDSAVAGLEGDDRPDYADWIGSDEARGHVLLAPCYTAAQEPGNDTPAENNGAESRRVPRSLPNTDASSATPPIAPTPKRTPEEVQAYFRSPEYRSLPKERRTEIRSQMATDVGLSPLRE